MALNKNITPVILAGGSGTRLWPLSRKSFPKQFSSLLGEKTLFQRSALRVQSSLNLKFNKPVVVTNNEFRFIVSQQLQEVGMDPGTIIIEPEAKNTAAAILAATLYIKKQNPNALLLVVPSDHLIPEVDNFHNNIITGIDSVINGNIVAFGISPTSPETGYGYLELSEKPGRGPVEVLRFVEKPEKSVAMEIINKGFCLWNAGIFLYKITDMLDAFEKYNKNILDNVNKSIQKLIIDLGFVRLEKNSWSNITNVSIDYAIMENLKNLMAIPYYGKWTDLGDWNSVYKNADKDKNGVALSKNAFAIDCKNSLLRTESDEQAIVGLGLENILAIAMPDAVLVADKSSAQNIKTIVSVLEEKNYIQATQYPKDYRPWGWFQALVNGDRFKVKRLHLYPGASISLQSHKYRSEHWVVVQGTAKVTIGKNVEILTEGCSTFIAVGTVHRLENPYSAPMVIVEVQIGNYLGEDDIIRYEDIYSRE